MSKTAPIVLFVYNRLDHTKQTIKALQKNKLADESDLFIYSDAAKSEVDIKKVDEVRKFINSIEGFKNISIIQRDENLGLANSIIDGVTDIVNRYGKIIVLEDDLVTSPHFLKFMNEALEIYKDEDKVYSISGYSFTDEIATIDDTYFLSITSSWSWATWANKWKTFERNDEDLSKFVKDKSNIKRFNFENSYYFTSMAKLQLDGKINSWAIYWYFSVFNKNGLTLYPAKKLVKNIGFDGSGVHCGDFEKTTSLVPFYPVFTSEIYEKEEIKKNVINILKRENSKFGKIVMLVKKHLKKHLSNSFLTKLIQIVHKLKLLFLKKDIGNNTYIDKTVHVTGWNSISIGYNTAISEYTWINVNVRTPNHKHIILGNSCYIGRRNFFSSGWLIKISDYCMTGIDCKFMGSDHMFNNPIHPYITTGTTNDKTIKLGTNVWLGANVSVIGNVNIGYGSIIGAGSLVTKNIPPFSIAIGNPCKVIKRFDFKLQQWVKNSEFVEEHTTYFPTEEEYINIIKEQNKNINIPLHACSRKFGDMF